MKRDKIKCFIKMMFIRAGGARLFYLNLLEIYKFFKKKNKSIKKNIFIIFILTSLKYVFNKLLIKFNTTIIIAVKNIYFLLFSENIQNSKSTKITSITFDITTKIEKVSTLINVIIKYINTYIENLKYILLINRIN
jgi:hypothetical protein